MSNCKFYPAGYTAALTHAVNILQQQGYTVLTSPLQATHLLLPVPSFEPDGSVKGGGSIDALLATLPKDITILGGNLVCDALAGYKTVDFLQDPHYVAMNANITAHCAIKLAMSKLPVTLDACPVLVIGWGRIGKCLARLLRMLDADVTVAARKASDRAVLASLGYKAADTATLDTTLYRVIFNTAPAMVSASCPGNALKIDLASKPGLGSMDVLWAKGLPAREAPESSGKLIADTAIRAVTGKEL